MTVTGNDSEGSERPETLTAEENLIAQVARATCFAYRSLPDEVGESDVHLYIDKLINRYRRKPQAVLYQAAQTDADTVAMTVRFCADQLKDAAPAEASRLLAVLEDRG